MEDYRDSVKSGYLMEKFRLFHLKDSEPKEYEYHYHDFYKLIWFNREHDLIHLAVDLKYLIVNKRITDHKAHLHSMKS